MPSPPRDRTFYEILCRGPAKCGTFASVRTLDACPKCGSPRILVRGGEGRRPAGRREPKD